VQTAGNLGLPRLHSRVSGVGADVVEDAGLDRTVPWVIFDGDCAFCTSSAHWVARRLNRPLGPNAQLVPWQFTDLAALGTTMERAQREALWVGTDGAIYGGAAAFAEWLRFRVAGTRLLVSS
jgi:predicted DCC family thiol-disulfide oxidoreductase YuxK